MRAIDEKTCIAPAKTFANVAQRRHPMVAAVQVELDRMEDIIEWARYQSMSGHGQGPIRHHRRDGKPTGDQLFVYHTSQGQVAWPGDWIVHDNAAFVVYTDTEFHRVFEVTQ